MNGGNIKVSVGSAYCSDLRRKRIVNITIGCVQIHCKMIKIIVLTCTRLKTCNYKLKGSVIKQCKVSHQQATSCRRTKNIRCPTKISRMKNAFAIRKSKENAYCTRTVISIDESYFHFFSSNAYDILQEWKQKTFNNNMVIILRV